MPIPCPADDACWIYLVRHGATPNNEARPVVLQGRSLDAELSPAGVRQAEQTADFLRTTPLSHCYSSPLKRAVQTAEPIAAPHGLEIETVDDLVEVNAGVWEGMCWAEIQETYPDEYARFMEDPIENPYLGGETARDVADRVVPALERIAAAHLGQSIVVVAHSVVNRALLAHALHEDLHVFRRVPQDNCAINIIRHDRRGARLVTVNAVFHRIEPITS